MRPESRNLSSALLSGVKSPARLALPIAIHVLRSMGVVPLRLLKALRPVSSLFVSLMVRSEGTHPRVLRERTIKRAISQLPRRN